MPLSKGTSNKSLKENIAKLMKEGYSREQAVAIAYEQQRRNKKSKDVKKSLDNRIFKMYY